MGAHTSASPAAATEVSFTKIGEAMALGTCQQSGATPMRALVATVVAVCPSERLADAAEALQSLGDAGTVRGILISSGADSSPAARVAGNTVALHGLKPSFLNNAVAALRLSSLPTLVWWRGGPPDTLEGLAELADRVVLDDESAAIWPRAAGLFEESAFSDLRWARLTQWRGLMAHFFDIPEVQAATATFTRLTISASDRMSARLFASWLRSSIDFREGFAVELNAGGSDHPIDEIRLGDHQQELIIRLAVEGTCLETEVAVEGHRSASQLVALRGESLTDLLTGELRIRSRDAAFERALAHLVAGDLPATP
jgi:glucose-6-phosphate dehydrogenase assembly protein OpcA